MTPPWRFPLCSSVDQVAADMAGRGKTGRRRRPSKAQLRRRREWIGKGLIALVGVALLGIGYAVLWGWQWPSASPHRQPLTMAQAREANAAIPFVAGPLTAAPRFVFHGTPAARLQATTCLATVAIYEAGDDRDGQRAVMQVVLNRVRRPGFPKTVCGVVYQGAGLKTGCQFSFACDGSVQRRPEHAGWEEARKAAKRALAGYVFADVGTATHYHTDWIVPRWIGSLDKIAQIDTHIFYRPHIAAAPRP
ncbi:cell wall hydrolase [Sphingomonas abietis]|uniref:Cell wall hydrolase n=1 Tax=Sphingomonas abietis TaxID=3012344 RepID=A0ABY7NR82_9SPHN|nr:cell wall hydrolase [Sphingomonas abietis]WBO24056.1 cell wall hydrolase [Sphingomonas abietis]